MPKQLERYSPRALEEAKEELQRQKDSSPLIAGIVDGNFTIAPASDGVELTRQGAWNMHKYHYCVTIPGDTPDEAKATEIAYATPFPSGSGAPTPRLTFVGDNNREQNITWHDYTQTVLLERLNDALEALGQANAVQAAVGEVALTNSADKLQESK